MPSPKYLKLNPSTGLNVEEAAVTTATPNSIPCTDATGHLTQAQMPTGVGPELKQAMVSEDLAAGNWVNFHSVGGVTKVRKADATNSSKPAQGFVKAGFSVATNDIADVYCDGQNADAAVSGLVAGSRCFLSATQPGATAATPPSTAGNLVQCVGSALDGTTVLFKPEPGVVLA
ncbi:MAG: hypothetical protein H7838_11410 [Magnetococcus sp. DMHC-8]